MNKLKSLLWVVLFATVAFSCSDDDDVTLSTSASLTSASKGWVVSAATISPAFLGITDWYAQLEACDQDDATIFTSDGKYKIESTVKCDSTEPTIIETGTWTLSSDNKVLSMTTGSDVTESTIVEANAGTIKVTQTDELNGVKYTLTMTMTPKK